MNGKVMYPMFDSAFSVCLSNCRGEGSLILHDIEIFPETSSVHLCKVFGVERGCTRKPQVENAFVMCVEWR